MRGVITSKQLSAFGWRIGGICTIVGLWPLVLRHEGVRLWALVLALMLIIPAGLCPETLKLPYRAWLALAQALGWLNARILLGAVFYGLVTPVGLMRRLLGHDARRCGFDPETDSYRILHQPLQRIQNAVK